MAAGMAGTVVLDDVELREAQRDYLDFLDDEVREAPARGFSARSLCRSVPGSERPARPPYRVLQRSLPGPSLQPQSCSF